jgi:hypothetical protein
MLLKELVFALRQLIAEKTGDKPSVGHTYEMLSALLGYDSFASLNSQAFIVSLSGCDGNAVENVRLLLGGILDLRRATERHVSLKAIGSPRSIAKVLETFAQGYELVAIPLSSILELYDGQASMDYATEYAFEELHGCLLDMEPPQLKLSLGMLEDHSIKEPSVHYVLYRIYDRLVDHHDSGSDYWLRQYRLGRPLSIAEQQFADEAVFAEKLKELRQLHLSKASSYGNSEAILVELEDAQKQATITAADFEVLESQAFALGHASKVASLAKYAGLTELAATWNHRAACAGDIEALYRLVSDSCAAPTVETWTWIYLGRLLGTDLTASTLRSYHAGGQYGDEDYDEDQGGDFYVDGNERLDVNPLSSEFDRDAQAAAAIIYGRILKEQCKT